MVRLFEVLSGSGIDPIPNAFRVDDLIRGSRIDGREPTTGEFPATIGTQIANAYATMLASVEAAGATAAHIGQVSFYFQNIDDRALINERWIELFPDPDDRPTYKFMPARLAGGQLLQMDFYAVPGASRRSIHVQGVAHANPIPMAVQIGRYLFTSRILAYDPATEKAAATAEEQADFVFQHAQTILDAAGFDWNDVSQGRGFVADLSLMPLVTERWMHRFQSKDAAPLHATRYGGGALQVMLELIAHRDE
jgi:2-iminobutanoate/2-iminopropanoate deaminase